MTYLLCNICTKNYWNRATIVEIIVDGWVVSFFENSVFSYSFQISTMIINQMRLECNRYWYSQYSTHICNPILLRHWYDLLHPCSQGKCLLSEYCVVSATLFHGHINSVLVRSSTASTSWPVLTLNVGLIDFIIGLHMIDRHSSKDLPLPSSRQHLSYDDSVQFSSVIFIVA